MELYEEKKFKEYYDNSYYTIVGAGGDLTEWVEGYNKILADENIGTPERWVTFKGRDVNKHYNLQGNNRFKNNITFLAFPLNGLSIDKLALLKLKMEDRWFDDIIDNSVEDERIEELEYL